MLFHDPGEHVYRRLYCPKGSTDQDSAPGVHAVCLQQWLQTEGVGLLQEGDCPGRVKDVVIDFWWFYSCCFQKERITES